MVDMWTTEILYSASSQLTAARAPNELLDAAIVYARVRGATCAQLIYITGDTTEQARGEVMAEWQSPNDAASAPTAYCLPFADPQDETARLWMSAPDEPFLVSDVQTDPRLSEGMRLQCADHNQVSVAVLPLQNQDRWVGALVFGWMRPYTFTDRDARIFTAVIRNVAPAIDSIRLMDESRERAVRAEYLLRISDALSKATDEGDILRALALYTDAQGGDLIALNYVADEHGDDPFPYEPIAWLAQGEVHYYRNETVPSARLADYGIKDLWALNPDDVLIIANVAEEPRLTPEQRTGIIENTPVRALAVLPLQAGGVFQGLFGVVWMQPHAFGDQELYIYHQLQQLLPNIVATRRAYLAEQAARYESEVLYRASAGVNAAHTFEEVLNALAGLPFGGQGVALSLLEHFDRSIAAYSDVIQRPRARPDFRYWRVAQSEFRFDEKTSEMDQLVTPDVTTDPRFDEQTRALYSHHGLRAVCDVILRVGSRILGYFIVHDTQPRSFSAQQMRMIAGIGDLVANAVERIRLQQATELARQRAELISRINAALLQSKDEAAILRAIADYSTSLGAAYIGLNYAVADGITNVTEQEASERIARWEMGTIRYFKDDTTPMARFTEFGVPKLWAAHPDRVLLVEDFEHETRLSDDDRSRLLAAMKTRATAIIPLYTGASFQGLLNISWHAPHTFTEEEHFVFQQLQQVLPAVVATRRAYLAEQSARYESEILYRAGKAINAAVTFDELLNAMIQLPLASEGVVLGLYESYDLTGATSIEVRGRRRDAPDVVSDRLTWEMFPHMRDYGRANITVITDVMNEPSFDSFTRETYARVGIGSFISVPLRAGERVLGFISFVNQHASRFAQQQQRLAAGMSDMVSNAVERIRLQIASDQARRRAELLSHLNAELLRATDEAGMLHAIADYGRLQGAARIGLAYAIADFTADISSPDTYERIARWDAPDTIVYYRDDPREEPRLAPFGVPKLWAAQPDRVFYVEDYGTDARLTPEQRAGILAALAFRASAIIPLYAGSSFQGFLTLHWTTPHPFGDEERHVYDQLRQVMPAVVASRRAYLAEQTARHESEILYRAGEQVNAAYTLEDLVATISQLPLTVNGVLLGVFDSFDAETSSYVDVLWWQANDSIGKERFLLTDVPQLRDYARVPFGVIEDLNAAVDFDAVTRAAFAARGVQSYVGVGLNVGERTLGFLTFCDSAVRKFTPAQRRLAAGVGDMVSNAVERIRLQAVTDQARLRAELLSNISNALLQATDEVSIVQAVAHYGERQGAMAIGLTYAVSDDVHDISTPEAYKRVARWERPGRLILDPFELERGPRLAKYGVGALWAAHPDRVLYVEDYTTDERLAQAHRDEIKHDLPFRASAIIPLYAQGTFQGMLGIHYDASHSFSVDERYIFERLRLVLPAVVGTRRAYLAEQSARHESEVLYRAGEAVNAANTFEDLLDAIAELPLGMEDVSLSLYEDFDAEEATYMDVLVRRKGVADSMRERLSIEQFPMMRTYANLAYLTVEDVLVDADTDPATQQTYAQRGLRSFIGTSLRAGGRTLGLLTFFDTVPRQFTQQQLRLAMGMGDLVVTAVERIRLQAVTDQARRRAETLSLVNAALLRSADEAQILEAIAEYAAARDADAVGLYYSDDEDKAGSMATVPIARWRDGVVQYHQNSPLPLLSDLGVQSLWHRGHDRVQLVEDFANEPRLSQKQRASILRKTPVRALAVIPLHTTGSFQGALVVFFDETHVFSDEETFLYAQLQQVLPAVVATRRAYLAEQAARYESEVLYRAGKAINAAHTYEDVLKAVAELNPPGTGISIGLFEGFDVQGASYMDIIARAVKAERYHRERRSLEDFPLVRTLPPHGVLVIDRPYTDDRIDTRSREVFAQWGVQSLISVSLMIGQQYLGILTFHDARARGYVAQEQHIAAGMADLVANAVERIALRMETEAGRYRAETISELHAALSRAVDEPSILGALSSYVMDCGGTAMLLRYADINEDRSLVRSWGVATWQAGKPPESGEAVGADERPYFDLQTWWGDRFDDVLLLQDITFADLMDDENRQRFSRVYGAQAIAALPLVSGRIFQGILAIFWDRPHTFTHDERYIFGQLMQTLPSVVATRRALLGEQQRAQQLEAVARVSAAVSSSLTRDELMRTVTRLAQDGFADQHFTLFLFDEGTRTLVQQSVDDTGAMPCAIPIGETKSLVAESARTLRGVYVNDMLTSEQYVLRAFFPEARSEMVVPMTIGAQLIGVLDVQSRVVQRYSHAELLVMQTLADLIAVAIQNIRLYEQAQEAAAYEERNRLARELHDSVSQALYGIALGARTARALLDRSPERLQQPLDYILSLADAGLMEMRALIFDLRVDSIQEEGLIAALAKQTASIGARHNISMDTEFCVEPSLSVDTKEALYWIAREALHNIIKHAQAKHVVVKVIEDAETLRLEIVDDGLGFAAEGEFKGHMGLKNLRERAARLNGTLDITSAPGQGTAIRVRVPIRQDPLGSSRAAQASPTSG